MYRSFRLFPLMLAAALPGAAFSLDLTLPAPVAGQQAASENPASVELPTGPFAGGALPVRRVTGALDRRAWQLEAPRLSLTELANPLREQLLAQGYDILFDCETRGCGGFDFRFAIQVMPEPGMHVDLGDFRFIAAEKAGEVVNLLVSRSPGYGFVQLTRVAPEPMAGAVPTGAEAAAPETAPPVIETPSAPVTASLPGDPGAVLEAQGAVVLEDLVFASGSSALEAADYASLAALAEWLAAEPGRRVALVGHTDNSGGLEANIALSRKRAQAVRQALLQAQGVQAAQVTAEGVGPLAPRATNLTEEGRRKNRRVEAVLTSVQ